MFFADEVTIVRPGHCYRGNRFARVDCGWGGITQAQCEARSCCYDSTYSDANNCFRDNGFFSFKCEVVLD